MRCLKTFGLAAAALTASLALASTASATQITSPSGTVYTSEIAAQAGATEFNTPATGDKISCEKSALAGKIEQHGTSVTAKGKLTSVSLSICAGGTITVLALGTLEFHTEGPGSNGNGTVTSTGLKLTTTDLAGLMCEYTTNNTHMGSATGGTPGVFMFHAHIPLSGGGLLCGSEAELISKYTVTTPSTFLVD